MADMDKMWCLVLLFYVFQLSDAQFPNLCEDASIDAITRMNDGNTYVFKDRFFWKVLPAGGFASGYPRLITSHWNLVQGSIDSALTLDGFTYLFWHGVYANNITLKYLNYPKPIHDAFLNVPGSFDAAFVWGKNNKAYFFYGENYFGNGGTSPITAWSNKLAGGIDAAMQWENGKTYFFKGDKYYRYNDETEDIDVVDPPYPRSTAQNWFNCP